MEPIKLAIAKGRLAKQSIVLMEKAGVDCSVLKENNRKLIFSMPEENLEIILLKAMDVPTYVEHGAVDMGIVGKDILMEQKKQLYEVLDLGIGKCRFAIAGKPDAMNDRKHLRVSTKFTNVAKKYFATRGQSVEIIKQEGSVELAPLMGLSHVILDIVETGNTLRDNGLVVFEEVADISARLVVNRVSFKTKKKQIYEIIDLFSSVI
ncbi:MAG: ATP phosphoribosyltransferase [Clostridiales bacterium]|nr:ATP phosphoribosyltransferase [Clostridiales bacterium]